MRLRFYQTASAQHPAQWTPEREETENAARVDEVYSPAGLRVAERCDHDRVERGSAVPDLLHELLAARDVSERARDRGAALGDDVGRAAARADPRGEVLEQLVDPPPLVVGAEPDLGAEQPVEQQVAVVLLGRRALEREDRLHAEPGGDGGDGAAAVGLERPARDQRVGAPGEGLADEELELADLVARLE